MDILAKRLKSLRENKKKEDSKFTQEYVAKLIGVARPTYTAYESGTKQPPLETLNRIADIFNVSTDYLQGRTENPEINKDEEFENFIKDPELKRWFKELPKSDEEDLRKLRKMWEIIKSEDENK